MQSTTRIATVEIGPHINLHWLTAEDVVVTYPAVRRYVDGRVTRGCRMERRRANPDESDVWFEWDEPDESCDGSAS